MIMLLSNLNCRFSSFYLNLEFEIFLLSRINLYSIYFSFDILNLKEFKARLVVKLDSLLSKIFVE